MRQQNSDSEYDLDSRISVGGQLVIPVFSVIFTLYYFSTILDSPWTAQVSAFMIGSVLIALCLIFIVKISLMISRKQADLQISELFSKADLSNGRVALFAITLGYILLINWGGFTLTTFLFLFLSIAVLNNGKLNPSAALVAGLMSLGGYGLFIVAFDTRFPRGPFEKLMESWLFNGI